MAERSTCTCCCHGKTSHNPITPAYPSFPYPPYPAYPYPPTYTFYPPAFGHPHNPYYLMPTGFYPPPPAHCYPGHPSCHTATPPAPEPTTKPECSEKPDQISEKRNEKPWKEDKKLLNLKKYGNTEGIFRFLPDYGEAKRKGRYKWVPTSIHKDNSFIVNDGLVIGTDIDGSDLYAARAQFSGDMIPGKYMPKKNMCTVTMCGQEASVDDFEVLIPTSFSWVKAMDGAVPPGAVPAGVCANGEKYYYGRVRHNDAIIPGKMQPSHGNTYYGIDGNEFSSKKYEILVLL